MKIKTRCSSFMTKQSPSGTRNKTGNYPAWVSPKRVSMHIMVYSVNGIRRIRKQRRFCRNEIVCWKLAGIWRSCYELKTNFLANKLFLLVTRMWLKLRSTENSHELRTLRQIWINSFFDIFIFRKHLSPGLHLTTGNKALRYMAQCLTYSIFALKVIVTEGVYLTSWSFDFLRWKRIEWLKTST